MIQDELDAVRARYERRDGTTDADRYSWAHPDVWQRAQESQRVLISLLVSRGLTDFTGLRVVEVGCGDGGNLLEFLRMGVQPENLIGIELREESVRKARRVLPAGVVRAGDASCADIAPQSQDIVFQSVVFSSLLDNEFQERLAARMWDWLVPGGGVIWYDFVYDNPLNPDVRGVPIRRIRDLFLEGDISLRRVTLAPPIARAVCRVHPALYTLVNQLRFLRTHVLCWIGKQIEKASDEGRTRDA